MEIDLKPIKKSLISVSLKETGSTATSQLQVFWLKLTVTNTCKIFIWNIRIIAGIKTRAMEQPIIEEPLKNLAYVNIIEKLLKFFLQNKIVISRNYQSIKEPDPSLITIHSPEVQSTTVEGVISPMPPSITKSTLFSKFS